MSPMNDFANKTSSMTKTFVIDIESEVDGKNYRGQFTTQKLNIGKTIELGVRKTQLAAGLSYNPESGRGLPSIQDLLCEMVAHCEVALMAKPDWFNDPLELVDMEILQAVYEEVISFENQFRNRTTGDGEQGSDEGVRGSDGHRDEGQSRGQSEPEGQRNHDPEEVVGIQISKKHKK